MALETLKDVEEIGGFNVIVMDELRDKYPEKFNESGGMDYQWFESEIRPKNFIYLRHDKNSISFTIQNGPIKEVGVNGCDIQTMIETSLLILCGLNDKFPCEENSHAIACLKHAIFYLEERKMNREQRGVEGKNLP